MRTSCHVGYFYYSENLNYAAQNLLLGRGLDIAALDEAGHGKKQDENKQTAKHRNKKGDST